jgi:hypothetical protein
MDHAAMQLLLLLLDGGDDIVRCRMMTNDNIQEEALGVDVLC